MIHEKRTDVFILGEGPAEEALRTALADDDRYRIFSDHAVLKAKKDTNPKTGAPLYAVASTSLQELVKWYWSRWFGFILIDCSNYEKWPQFMTAQSFTAPPLSIPTVMFEHTAKMGAKDEELLAEQAQKGARRFFCVRAVQPGVASTPEAMAAAAREKVLPFAVSRYCAGAFGLFNWWEHYETI